MVVEYSVLRSLLLEHIKQINKESHPQFSIDVLRQLFNTKGMNLDEDKDNWRRVEQVIHEFYIDGIIIPGSKTNRNTLGVSHFLQFPLFKLTEFGERVVSQKEYQPYDPDGYLQKIQSNIPDIDQVIIRYLAECLACFRHNLLLASAVMLGCAAEKSILILIDSFANSLQSPDKTNFLKETNTFMIKPKYEALWKRLQPKVQSLPMNLRDNLGNIIDRIFDLIRTTRNDAGHPSGNIIEKETVHANLLLFPIFCKRIYKLISHFNINLQR
jgi:hypothetical protein